MQSERLTYTPLTRADADAFHGLVRDAHVRRYLLDGKVVSADWTLQRIDDSEALFARRGVGLRLAHERRSGELVGFCGFLELPPIHVGPQLVYALFERFTGMGYASEMARAAILDARMHAGLGDVVASVDEVNVASRRVLDKLGFDAIASSRGTLGTTLLLRLRAAESTS